VVELCSKRIAFGAEITCIAWDRANEATFRLATGTRDRCVQLWSFNGKEVHEVFSRQLASTILRNIDFMENHAADLYVFGIYDGRWYVHYTPHWYIFLQVTAVILGMYFQAMMAPSSHLKN
jgi:hypothetical protein